MKGIRLHPPGGIANLVYSDFPAPTPSPHEILIKVHAAALTTGELVWSETGARKLPVPCHDVSGSIESYGSEVDPAIIKEFAEAGNEVYGLIGFDKDGAAAEYTLVQPSELAPKPKSLKHEHAAAVPLSALTAWQSLFVHADVKKGTSVLVTGAAGGVGVMAVQLASWAEARVVGLGSGKSVDFIKGLGAGEVIDYTVTPLDRVQEKFDVVVECVGGETLDHSFERVKDGGVLLPIANPFVQQQDKAYPGSRIKITGFIVESDREQLKKISALLDEGKLKPVVADIMPLAEGRKAFEIGAQGHTKGKIVLKVNN
ncbi:MAG: hypothetical protein M1812_000420 [Candelaria pacifica]|nr:MAG: hypothetical protein M1812_000420 [Candelaria pacifica]